MWEKKATRNCNTWKGESNHSFALMGNLSPTLPITNQPILLSRGGRYILGNVINEKNHERSMTRRFRKGGEKY